MLTTFFKLHKNWPSIRFQGFQVEAIWGLTREEADVVAKDLNIPYSTNRIDDVLLRKDVDLILVLCPPSHHSQITVKALGTNYLVQKNGARDYWGTENDFVVCFI
jgi:predicted dehydrogenase